MMAGSEYAGGEMWDVVGEMEVLIAQLQIETIPQCQAHHVIRSHPNIPISIRHLRHMHLGSLMLCNSGKTIYCAPFDRAN